MAAHNELGKWGENLAAQYIEELGHKVVARDWHCGRRDLDIVTIHDNTLTIIEVKTRSDTNFTEPEAAITKQKIMSIGIATNAFVKTYCINMEVQFDIIFIIGSKDDYQIRHIPDAFIPF